MDKGGEFENLEVRHLGELFLEASESRLLVVSKERAEVYTLLDLGDHGVQSIRAGETEYVMRTAYQTPVLDKAYRISLNDSLDSLHPKEHEHELVNSVFIDTARHMAEAQTDTEEKLTCINCRAEAYFISDCSCTQGGVVFSDDESSEVSQLREKGIPDDSCESCGGLGKVTNSCVSCKGTGYNYKYPILTITNYETGNSTTELLDVAQLVASGKVPMYTSYEGKQITAQMSVLVKSMAAKVGINPQQLIGVGKYGGYEVGDARSELSVQPLGYSRSRNNQEKPAPMTQQEILQSMQNQLVRTFTHQWESIVDESGVARGREYKVAELPSSLSLLKELIETVEVKGYRLAYKPSFIETGVTGPSFFVLNRDMQIVTQLSAEDSLSLAIFNAHEAAKQELA